MINARHEMLFFVVALFCICTYSNAQDEGQAQARDLSTKLLNIQRNWGSKISTSGLSLTLKPNGTGNIGEHGYASFELFGVGFPKNAVYTLTNFPIDLKVRTLLEGVTFNDAGRAICAGKPGTCVGDKPDDEINLKLMGADGEPARLALVSDDGKYKAFVSVIPFPVKSKDQACTIHVIRLLPGFELALLQGSGFPLMQKQK